MGKPRMIILIRHAQSEGNKNREIHQLIPDHRVKLTDDGWNQAEDAGHRLRSLLKPDDTLQIFTSPYRRTRETTEGILRTLTSPSESGAPSPFNRHAIKVYEEPRLREQDFGNFQPCSAEMERMWQERADYGHFFYRIPNGESAADAYDRVSGFNESLWRSFGEADFPSVCVLVTHGLMTRVFLMKWYHWSVEYFEDLRNVNHCEFIIMDKNIDNGKYLLKSELRTWSELKKQRALEAAKDATAAGNNTAQHRSFDPKRRNTLSQFLPSAQQTSAPPPPRKWGGCVAGCDHQHDRYPRRKLQAQPSSVPRQDKQEPEQEQAKKQYEGEDHPIAHQEDSTPEPTAPTTLPIHPSKNPTQRFADQIASENGSGTPHEEPSDNEFDYFDPASTLPAGQRKSSTKRPLRRRPTEEDLERWAHESGMGSGKRADALGDEPDEGDEEEEEEEEEEEGLSLEEQERKDKSLKESVY
ncbi:hypothetical protein Q7P37_005534 [Cladosporium fusiforme]